MEGTPEQIIKNSVCDACAQATEGYDSKLGNDLTRTLCKQAFDVLYDAIMNDKPENYPYGSMLSGMGFGNCSTTLGHALSYVFSMRALLMDTLYLHALPKHTNTTNQFSLKNSKKLLKKLVSIK